MAETKPFLIVPSGDKHGCDNDDLKDSQGEAWAKCWNIEGFEDFIRGLKIRNCRDDKCRAERQKLEDVAPPCGWSDLRLWALVVTSCSSCSSRSTTSSRSRPDPSSSEAALDRARYACFSIQESLGGYQVEPDLWQIYGDLWQRYVDLFGIFEVAYWVAGCFARDFLRGFVEGRETKIPAIRNAMIELSNSTQVCRRRLWNLASTCDRGLAELPQIMSFVRKHEIGSNKLHGECTADVCRFDDDNSTNVEQLHKCESKKCGEFDFNPETLNNLDFEGTPKPSTAWNLARNGIEPSRFMALSHVWSDGTGRGGKPPGTVNSCLFDFLSNFARQENCYGIWWDTISLPTDPKSKAIAMVNMHLNYKNATFTLVHDEQLVKMTWKDDGSPCVALALSTWFSRGWTALELQQSQKVKVLFRDPNNRDNIIMKDLDNDILAKEGDWTHLAHRAATNAIRNARRQNNPDFIWDVVHTLRMRYTSWARDRMLIACLMLGVEIEYTWSMSKMTQEVLKKFNLLGNEALFHGQLTMQAVGPWSWCPVSFLDLNPARYDRVMRVKDNGEITGQWFCISAKKAKISHSLYYHESLRMRIETALEMKREKCLLLTARRPRERTKITCILAVDPKCDPRAPMDIFDKRICEYIGTVVATWNDGNWDDETWDHSEYFATMSFGSEEVYYS